MIREPYRLLQDLQIETYFQNNPDRTRHFLQSFFATISQLNAIGIIHNDEHSENLFYNSDMVDEEEAAVLFVDFAQSSVQSYNGADLDRIPNIPATILSVLEQCSTPCATAFESLSRWNQTGIVVAGNGTAGSDLFQLNVPWSLFIDSADNLYIADSFNHRIVKYPPGGGGTYSIVAGLTGSPGTNASQLNYPRSVAVDSNQNIWIADASNTRIQYFPSGSHVGTRVAGTGAYGVTSSAFGYMYALALDTVHNLLYICDYANSRVLIWDSTGSWNSSSSIINITKPLSVKVDMARGMTYIVNYVNSLVYAFPFGSTVGTALVASGFTIAYNIGLDKRGNLFAATLTADTVQMFCLNTGNITGVPVMSNFTGAWDVAFDSNYNMYVLDQTNNRVLKFNQL
ncbi:unnamed protein product [Didymodactylos carnosus]|uniref:NHL repeat containing protein n=1 Tax=Didymodactylos carnosus TaxID=1234261 RepID=A0A814XP35_9BILA|nr:unnamed protein product [Didymodactylos carnosus]CAF1217592.1 unnamed protein product [Didymodactylos carnosus]CAF3857149.1 unnamed protein product [Didymodactylos carnosus]CAF3981169.1 unnamed protein product [Didymodactylos carnosus]